MIDRKSATVVLVTPQSERAHQLPDRLQQLLQGQLKCEAQAFILFLCKGLSTLLPVQDSRSNFDLIELVKYWDIRCVAWK